MWVWLQLGPVLGSTRNLQRFSLGLLYSDSIILAIHCCQLCFSVERCHSSWRSPLSGRREGSDSAYNSSISSKSVSFLQLICTSLRGERSTKWLFFPSVQSSFKMDGKWGSVQVLQSYELQVSTLDECFTQVLDLSQQKPIPGHISGLSLR